MEPLHPGRQPGSDRGQSPVGNGSGAGFPKPLQGRDKSPRIARIAQISAERVCGVRRAIWSVAGHRRGFEGDKDIKNRVQVDVQN